VASFFQKKATIMHVLKEYISIIETFEFKRGEKEALLGNGNTKLSVFYDGIRNGTYTNDSVAAKMLYDKKPNHAAYKMLKSDLKKRLVQLVFIVEFKQEEEESYSQAFYEARKNWSMLNILQRRGKIVAALDLAENLLQDAKKYELTDMIINATHLLSHLYAHQLHDEAKTKVIRDLYNQHLPILEAEKLAEFYYYEIIQHFIKSKLIPRYLSPTTSAYFEKIQPFLLQYNTINLNLYGRLIKIFDHLCKYEYQQVIDEADDAIAFFNQKGFMPSNFKALFLHHKAKAQLQLGQYTESLKYIRMSLDSEPIGTHNWFNRGVTMMKLYLFTEQYQDAWELFKALIDHMDNQQKQVQVLMEEFRIYEAFMQFLIVTKRIKLGKADDDFFVRPYDSKLFNKSVLILSKDRMGMNISIQIIQLLHTLIAQSQKSKTRDMQQEIFEHIASLEYYRNAYLKKSENIRHDLFVKLLNQAVKGHFRTKRIHREAQEELEALRAQKGVGDIYADMGSEILKHETAWSFMGQYWD
jgi:hypothetical protein